MHTVKIDEYIVLDSWHIFLALDPSVEGHSGVCFGGADCGVRILEVEERISKDYQSQ